jgi:seryl-tRNA synthetase
VEQFFVTSPDNNASWAALEEMLTNAEDFYQALDVPYQVKGSHKSHGQVIL